MESKLNKHESLEFSDILNKIEKSLNHDCPICNSKTLDYDCDTYEINSVKYPIFGNVRMVNEKNKHGCIWDEIHKCHKCDTLFYYHGDSVISSD
jgi:hypothetical protein